MAETNEFISFLRGFLLAFAGIALFVASFVIANSPRSPSPSAARVRDAATLGASRRQVLRSIVVEALVVGIVASVIGLFLGFALASGLFALFEAVGFTLPNTGLTFETRTAVVALLVGILVTLFASLRLALRATRVPPIAAVREGATPPPGRFARYRGLGAALTAVAGFAALLYGLFGSGLGTTQVLLGWASARPHLPGRRALLVAPRPLARDRARLAGDEDRRRRGIARTGQLEAQPAAHRVDRRRADDRPACHARRDARGGIVNLFEGAVNDLWKGSSTDYALTAQNNFSPIPSRPPTQWPRRPASTRS